MDTKLVNVTPHAIQIADGPVFEPSGLVVRVRERRETAESLAGIPVEVTVYESVEGLPAPEAGVVYIASAMVRAAAAALGRTDVVSPDTGPTAVRNEKGHIVAVKGFVR